MIFHIHGIEIGNKLNFLLNLFLSCRCGFSKNSRIDRFKRFCAAIKPVSKHELCYWTGSSL